MPAAIGFVLAFAASNAAAVLGASVAAQAVIAATFAKLGGVVLSIGLSIVGQLLRGTANIPRPSDGQTEIKQPLAPRERSYGRVRKSGVVWWLDVDENDLYLGLAVNHGRISEFVSFHIDDNEVEIDGTDKVTTSPYSTQNIYIHNRLGAATETTYNLNEFGAITARGDVPHPCRDLAEPARDLVDRHHFDGLAARVGGVLRGRGANPRPHARLLRVSRPCQPGQCNYQ